MRKKKILVNSDAGICCDEHAMIWGEGVCVCVCVCVCERERERERERESTLLTAQWQCTQLTFDNGIH